MPEWLEQAFATPHEIRWEVLLFRAILAFALGLLVAGIYWLTHQRDNRPAPNFLTTLVLLSILIAMVTQIIGESIARAFSLVGALSIVRFRTMVEDTRDIAFVIFAVVVGMTVGLGVQNWGAAVAGVVVVGVAATVFRLRFSTTPTMSESWTLSVRLGLGSEPAALVEPVLIRHGASFQLLSAGTGRQGAALDLTYQLRFDRPRSPTTLVQELNHMDGIQSVELRRS